MKTLLILKLLPKNLISRISGLIASMYIFPLLRKGVYGFFVRLYKINMEEAELPISKYKNFNQLFTRRLKKGSRPIPRKADAVISPVDGTISEFGKIAKRRLMQAKGLGYSLSGLLQDENLAKIFENGYFITIYLSPNNYHRVHSAVSCGISGFGYIPGKLWPVHSFAVRKIKELFAVNERAIVYHCHPAKKNKTILATVMVGAFNVGKMTLGLCNLRCNGWSRRGTPYEKCDKKIDLQKGDELGIFELGSTVILLFPKNLFTPTKLTPGSPVKMGRILGKIRD